MTEDTDINNSIDDFLSNIESPPTNSGIGIKVGIAVFIALVSAFFIKIAYEEYQIQKFKREFVRGAQTFSKEMDRINKRNRQRLRIANNKNQRRHREMQVLNTKRETEKKRKQSLDNYWKDIGSGTFINIEKSKRNGDLATAVIKINAMQYRVDINCNQKTFWSKPNSGWFSPTNKYTTEYKMIRTACSKGLTY